VEVNEEIACEDHADRGFFNFQPVYDDHFPPQRSHVTSKQQFGKLFPMISTSHSRQLVVAFLKKNNRETEIYIKSFEAMLSVIRSII
jgi:hypothetical protein